MQMARQLNVLFIQSLVQDIKTSVARFKRLDKIKEKLTDKLENIYLDYTTPLVVTARFSNGETMYAEA